MKVIYQIIEYIKIVENNMHLTFSLPNKARYIKKKEKTILEWRKIALKDIVKPHQIIYRCANKKSKHYNLSISLKEIDNEILKALSYLKVWDEEFKKYIAYTNKRLENLEINTKDKINSISLQIRKIKSERTKYLKTNPY